MGITSVSTDTDITHRQGRITRKDALEFGEYSKRIENYMHKDKKLQQVWQAFLFNDMFWNASIQLGKPNVNLPEYESSPGLWIFDDKPTGIVFLIYSDSHHKKPWKGTSYEAIAQPNQVDKIGEAFKRLLEYTHPSIELGKPRSLARTLLTAAAKTIIGSNKKKSKP